MSRETGLKTGMISFNTWSRVMRQKEASIKHQPTSRIKAPYIARTGHAQLNTSLHKKYANVVSGFGWLGFTTIKGMCS